MAKPKKLDDNDNIYVGTKNDDVVFGLGGGDSLTGGGGNDKLLGGDGNDSLIGGSGNDKLIGGLGDDIMNGGTGVDVITALDGVDQVDGGSGKDTLIVAGKLADATIMAEADGISIVTARGTVTVKNIEVFRFEDKILKLGDLPTGKVIPLQQGVETTSGGNGGDIFVGTVDGTATQTFDSGDTLDGKQGQDVLRFTSTLAAAATVTPAMTGIERVEATLSGAADATLNMINSSGVTRFTSQGSSRTLIVDNQDAIAALAVSNLSATAGVTMRYQGTAVAGASDVQDITVANNGSIGTSVGFVVADGIETFAIHATGINNFGAIGGLAMKTIVVDGTGSFKMSSSIVGLTTFNGSNSSGNLAISFGLSDVKINGGTGDDEFRFGSTLTSADSVNGGGGQDAVFVSSDSYSGSVLAGLNALIAIESVHFEGSTINFDNAAFSNAAVKELFFATTGADAILNANSATSYAFGGSNYGNAKFTMAAGQSTLNLAFTASTVAKDGVYDPVGFEIVDTSTATTVNILSTGSDATERNVVSDFTNVSGSRFVVTGDANTLFGGFSGAVTIDASGLTGKLFTSGSDSDDTIIGSTGGGRVSGRLGIDKIDISAGAGSLDTVVFGSTTPTNAERDVVVGFESGPGKDEIELTKGATSATGTTVVSVQDVTTNAGTVVFSSTADVLELSFDIAGTDLGDESSTALNGSNLLAHIGTMNVQTNGHNGYIIAYQAGNAYLYYLDEGDAQLATSVQGGEVALIATFKDIAAGSLDPGNFLF